jgi:hypothetical protein
MITPSFSLTATERVLPKLALDWTTGLAQPRVDVTRAGVATFVGSNGLIQSASTDTQRIDWVTGTAGLLVEESRTNVQPYSNAFSQSAVWTNVRSSLEATTVLSPDGTQNATKLVEDNTASNTHLLISDLVLASNSYSYSIFAKAGERTRIALFCAASADFSVFNLTNGTIVVTGTETPSITSFGNGWYRCSIKTSATTTPMRVAIANGAVISYSGDGASGVYVYGGQMEVGAFATSYIPTEATAVTRNADVATMTGTNFSDFYNATEGGVVVQVLPSTIIGTRPAVQFDDNTANESIALRGVAADPQLFVVDGGVTQATLDAGTIAANTLYKLGAAWKDASYAVAINGAAAVTQASGTFPTATQARLGSDGTNYLNGHLQSLRFWPQRLTNAEVQAFSK